MTRVIMVGVVDSNSRGLDIGAVSIGSGGRVGLGGYAGRSGMTGAEIWDVVRFPLRRFPDGQTNVLILCHTGAEGMRGPFVSSVPMLLCGERPGVGLRHLRPVSGLGYRLLWSE